MGLTCAPNAESPANGPYSGDGLGRGVVFTSMIVLRVAAPAAV